VSLPAPRTCADDVWRTAFRLRFGIATIGYLALCKEWRLAMIIGGVVFLAQRTLHNMKDIYTIPALAATATRLALR